MKTFVNSKHFVRIRVQTSIPSLAGQHRISQRALACSDQGVPNAMVGIEPYKQNTEITKQEVVQSTSLGGESFYAKPFSYERSDVFESTGYICSEKVHASNIKDASLLKVQKSILVHEDKTRPPGYKHPTIGTDGLLTKTPRTGALNSSSDIVQAVNAVMKDNFAVEMPDLLSEDCDIVAIELSYVPEMLIEPTFGCFSIPARKKEREINQDNNLEHITTEGGELLVSSYHRLVTQSEEISAYKEEKQPNVRSISCFKSLSTKPLHLTLRDKIGSQIRRHALKVADLSATGSYLTTEYLEQRGPIACFKEGSGSKENEIVIHYPTIIGRSFMHKDINGNFCRSPPPNGKVVKDDYGPSGLRTYNRWLRDGRLRDCVELLESMERKRLLDIDKVHHTRFLKACKSQKAVKVAFHFSKLIRKPTLSTFNMLLSVCASSQDFYGAFQVMLLVKEAGLRADCKLYTTLISNCGKCGKVDNMFELFVYLTISLWT